ncbi:four-helix bundle copper-binding protein [Sphingobacterium arenae]|uniref:Four-helix bundle copper-binding protein n=1 Tax=Sphingobacterium arenae TaxID=1280598 RepID=A0ABR7Y397_9SPHI|nr:four-helix bundle copper-binding protein [Sphingobacterium arenae]MBD1425794.1 four-helix bundle copper-binding protein [Sphingobacterium arenae]
MIQTKFQNCIEACGKCAVACSQCAVACLNEKDLEHLKTCIQLNLECTMICDVAVKVMSIDGQLSEELCEICADICERCAEECEKHAAMGMEHCRECAEACRICTRICREMSAA